MLGSERAERRPIRFSKWWLTFLVVAPLGLFMNSYAADTSSKPSPAAEGCTENQAKTNPPSGQEDDRNVSGLEGEEAELGIAINPTDESDRVIAGHSPCRTVLNTFHTLNSGDTWSRRSLGCQGLDCDWDSLTVGVTRYDPTVAFGPDGALYVAYGVSADGEDLVCARSMDGGVTFDRFAYVASAYELDKYLLTTGPKVGDPDHYNVYLTYSKWNGSGNWEVHLATCTNPTGTDFAFTRDLRMSPDEADESHTFAMPGVDAEGTVYVVWDDITD